MKTDRKKVSYVLGQSVGVDFRHQGVDVDPDVFVESFKDAFMGKAPSMSVGEMQQVISQFQAEMQEKTQRATQAVAAENLKKGKAFLDENKSKDGVMETSSGLQYKVINEGTGNKPAADDTIVAHYEGKTVEGTIFDSSYQRGTPATFGLNQVIKGWTEGLQLMKEGAKYELYIPSNLAYGEQGSQGTIAPNATLIFTVELINIK